MLLLNNIRCNIMSLTRLNLYNRTNAYAFTNYRYRHCVNSYTQNNPVSHYSITNFRNYSSDDKKGQLNSQTPKIESVASDQSTVSKVSQRMKLKQAVRDYGATIVVFHVAISLTSLGICYVAISNGVDAIRLLTFLGFSESLISSKVAVGGSTFVMAYAVHKVFAPIRIAITLSVAPFIVKYLRKINLLRPPKKQV